MNCWLSLMYSCFTLLLKMGDCIFDKHVIADRLIIHIFYTNINNKNHLYERISDLLLFILLIKPLLMYIII